MKVIVINNTSVNGKSITADPRKVINLKDDDARALIGAGKAVPAPADRSPADRSPAEKPKKADDK